MLLYESVLTAQRLISPVLTPRHPYYAILVQRREHLGLYLDPSGFWYHIRACRTSTLIFIFATTLVAMFNFCDPKYCPHFRFEVLRPYLLI